MKLQTNYEKVQSFGATDVADFSVALNAKTFKALSDTLYTDKIGSIVRELASNAVDAHRAADNNDPYEIHIPDNFEPYFSIRDYGIGISPDDIVNVYCKYFESTKDHANDDIGAFGLGAKTPFCYTDSYTITSIHKGIKRVYNAHINNGIPKIVQFGKDEHTDEHDGLEVSMSVKTDDFKAFRTAVIKQLKFFDDKPKIINGTIEWPKFEMVNEINNFIQYQHTNNTYYGDSISGSFIVQGGVGYPVDFGHIISYAEKIDAPKNIIKFLKFLNRSGTYVNCIEMPIGSVGVTISRESLSYDDITIKNIYQCASVITDNISAKIFENLDKAYKEGHYEFSKTFNALDKFFTDILDKTKLESKYRKFVFNEYRSGLRCEFPIPDKLENMLLKKYGCRTRNNTFGLETTQRFKKTKNGIATTIVLETFPEVVYIQDIPSYPSKRMGEVGGGALLYIPNNVTVQYLKKIFTNTEFHNISEIEYTPARRNYGGKTKQTDTRNFFYVEYNNINNLLKPHYRNTTLFKLGAREEFDLNFEDITTPCAYFVTERNRLDLDVYSDIPLRVFFDYAKKDLGYMFIAIPERDIKRADKNDILSFNELWKKQKDNFIASIENNIEREILIKYHNLVSTQHFDVKLSNFRDMFNTCKITSKVDFDAIFNIVDNIVDENILSKYDDTIKEMLNARVTNIIKEYEENVSHYTQVTDLETLLAKFNITPEFKLTDVFNNIMNDIKDNIDRIAVYCAFNDERITSWTIYEYAGYCSGNNHKLFDADELDKLLENKMKNWT